MPGRPGRPSKEDLREIEIPPACLEGLKAADLSEIEALAAGKAEPFEIRANRIMRILINSEPNHVRFAERFLKIRTKDMEIVPFRHNRCQRYLDGIVDEMEKAKKPIRLIILKARQPGVTTWSGGEIDTRAMKYPNSHGVLVAQDEERARDLFEMTHRFVSNLPVPLLTDFSSRKEIVFTSPHNSKLSIETGEKKDAGRGLTINFLHCSEVAFWPYQKETMASLMHAVPPKAHSWVVVESTANGMGNWFYKNYWEAVKGANKFRSVFFPWFWIDEYRSAFDGGAEERDAFMRRLDEHERELSLNFDVKPEQLKWRRETLATQCDGDVDLFNQDFPYTPESAFLSTGRPVFNMQVVHEMMEACEEPAFQGTITFSDQRKVLEAHEKEEADA